MSLALYTEEYRTTAIYLFRFTLKARIQMIMYRLVAIWVLSNTSLSLVVASLGTDNIVPILLPETRSKGEKRMCDAKNFITFIVICALFLVIMTFL